MEKDKFNELDRRIQTTATNRFNASARLKKHDKFSLWTVMIFSLGLILVSILSALNVQSYNSPLFINISSIFFSIAILTISTALSMSNFGARAEKFLDCGRELHALALAFKVILSDYDARISDNYEKYQKEYEHILSRYENHKYLDHLYTRLMWKESYDQKWYNYLNTYFRFFVEYLIYIVLVIVEIVWMIFLFRGLN